MWHCSTSLCYIGSHVLAQALPAWQRWMSVGPSEDGGGGSAIAMGNCLLLANPATSLEQPETQPCLCQEGQSSHALGRTWGIEPRHQVEGGPTRTCPRLSNELHHSLAANPYTAHPDSPAAHTQRHLHQSRQQSRSPASRIDGEGEGGWLATLAMGLDDPGTPTATKAAAPASTLQGGGGGGLADHIGDVTGCSMNTSTSQGSSPGLQSPGRRWVG